MIDELEKKLCCPNCNSINIINNENYYLCISCKSNYPVILGIIDFRDVRNDMTAGFSVEADRVLAKQLENIFDKVKTFNELNDIFAVLRTKQILGEDITKIDLDQLILEEKILPRNMTQDQLIHGHAILNKLPQYVENTSFYFQDRDFALENGCGLGYFIDGLAANFKNVAVLDFSLAYLMLAKKICHERKINNALLVCGSVERLPFCDNSFDLIHSNNVIEHVTNQKAMFAEAKRVVKLSGLFFVLSPNRFSIYFEPHYLLPFFGFIPISIRRWVIRIWQKKDIDEVSLCSLNELRQLAYMYFGESFHVTFIPRRIDKTITGGLIRNLLLRCLKHKFLGEPTHFMINKLLLAIMPYHVLLCYKQEKFLK